MRIRSCGDAMLLVEFEAVIDPLINEQVIALAARIRDRRAFGVQDVVPGYCTIGVHFNPLHTDLSALEHAIEDEARTLGPIEQLPDRAAIEIGVRYGGQWGPDLDAVAAHAGCSADEVIARHSGRTYRVYMLGFVPGFAYMGRVDPSIAIARHRVPRERVSAGSVGIAGEQTGVYPIESPGGWHLIGRTGTTMFDAERTPPNLVAPGDFVRFVPLPEGAA
ncbi:MAG: 5-oxoprolinase subunit PxpB [Acidobacteriota bacterium]|nr:5-oxoprolinase subunit PxpB [Acidobacteriota bacterium]